METGTMNSKNTWLSWSMLAVLLIPSMQTFSEDRPNQSEETNGEALEPEVTIIHKDEKTIQEYRVNGQFYMAKITPAIGRPYYLIDADGDGNLETKSFELAADFAIPSWVILTW